MLKPFERCVSPLLRTWKRSQNKTEFIKTNFMLYIYCNPGENWGKGGKMACLISFIPISNFQPTHTSSNSGLKYE